MAAGDGRILVGGGAPFGNYPAPAILVQPPANSKVSREEVFGLVTCIYRFTKLAEAIEAANSLSVAFQASIFTREIGPARAAERLDASAVMVNDHTAFRTDWMPFTGQRYSGYGIGGIPWSMHEIDTREDDRPTADLNKSSRGWASVSSSAAHRPPPPDYFFRVHLLRTRRLRRCVNP